MTKAIYFHVGERFRVLDVVKDATGYPTIQGVGYVESSRSGGSFLKGHEFEIVRIDGMMLFVKSTKLPDQEVIVFKETLRRSLRAGICERMV